jgi:hypothetical protein
MAFTASQILPWNGLLRYISTTIDPTYRKASTFGESFIKDIPGLSKNLPAYKSPLGEEQRRGKFDPILPYSFGTEGETEKKYIPLLKERTEKLKTNAQFNQLNKKIIDPMVSDITENIMKGMRSEDWFKNMSEDEKMEVYKRVQSKIKSKISNRVKAAYISKELQSLSDKERVARIAFYRKNGILTDTVLREMGVGL